MIDTGDDVSMDGLPYRVACNHAGRVHLMGHPERIVDEARCTLIRQASEAERLELLQALAASTWSNHRNTCARARLADMAQVYDSGCC